MNFIFLSPHFPPNYYRFCVQLKNLGARVLGLADEPYGLLNHELRNALTEYYLVNNMHNYDELLRACGYRVTAMEGIPGEHSPKSTLLRAVRQDSADEAARARTEYLALRHACGDVDLALARALADWRDAAGVYGLAVSS